MRSEPRILWHLTTGFVGFGDVLNILFAFFFRVKGIQKVFSCTFLCQDDPDVLMRDLVLLILGDLLGFSKVEAREVGFITNSSRKGLNQLHITCAFSDAFRNSYMFNSHLRDYTCLTSTFARQCKASVYGLIKIFGVRENSETYFGYIWCVAFFGAS